MRKFELDGFRRISKAAARKRFEAGKVVYLCPVNLRPDNLWNLPASIKYGRTGTDFDDIVDIMTVYNCGTAVLGRYLAYYERVGASK